VAAKSRKPERGAEPSGSPHGADVLSLALGALGLLSALALGSHRPDDASFGAATGADAVANLAGPFGANLAFVLFETLGYAAWTCPVVLLLGAWRIHRRRRLALGWARGLALLFLGLSGAALLSLSLSGFLAPDHFPPGGIIGRVFATGMTASLGEVGAWIVATTLLLACALVVLRLSLQEAAAGAAASTSAALAGMRSVTARLSQIMPAEVRLDEKEADSPQRKPRVAASMQGDDDEDDEPAAKDEAPVPPPRREARSRREEEETNEREVARPNRLKTPSPKPFHLRLRLRRSDDTAAPREEPAEVAAAPEVVAPPKPSVSEGVVKRSRLLAQRAAAEAAAPPAPPEAAAVEPPPPPAEEPAAPRKKAAAADAPPSRSSESGFIAPAAKEVLASADSGEHAVPIGQRATIAKAVKRTEGRARDFRLPPTSLLSEAGEQAQVDEAELMECAAHIVAKCAEFGVGGQVLHIHPGPVVTTYEFKPDAGVKFSRICSLEDDLALALKAETIRIDRIPGKNTVGIEVPNKRRETIVFRELGESDVFAEAASKLTIILGKTIDGAPYVADLAKMPHLLIAGSTGSGKSVALNSMITSILFKATPEEVKLIMVDPKMLELGMYKDIPHLLTPVVTNPKLASNALKWGVKEMEQRYARLAGCGVRNIEQYNAWVKQKTKDGAAPLLPDGSEHAPLAYIVIVIDELADLMMVAANDVEDSICRLAQMARAVGIHLILATQRPSVDVITGVIKANLPARLAMRVASKVDSRTILDSNGAEQLLGKGDMLFLPSGSSRLMRLHGPYLSETETAAVCDYLRTQREPVYDEKICEEEPQAATDEKGGPGGPKDDELFEQAARIVVERGEASVSYLQRRLKIGYSRAARLVDMLEEDGIVGGADGSKAREVLVGPDYFAELDRARQATSGA
jgi:S-DNA-T family DNA segregation ATPase FtsK/SpoIIIE